MPTALMAPLSAGAAITNAPTPLAQSSSKAPQPMGTPQTKRIAGLSPQLAPMAAAMVVLGPGVKLMAVARTRNALNSTAVIVVVMVIVSAALGGSHHALLLPQSGGPGGQAGCSGDSLGSSAGLLKIM